MTAPSQAQAQVEAAPPSRPGPADEKIWAQKNPPQLRRVSENRSREDAWSVGQPQADSAAYFCHVRFLWRLDFKRLRRLCLFIFRRRFFFRLPMV